MTSSPSVTGDTILEAQFVTVVGILIIPFWLLFSRWYCPEYLRRASARLTTQAVEVRKGVFNRSETTIPLNRITDVRLHDGPVMRFYGVRGVKLETAGQLGDTGSEGNLIGVVDAAPFRDAVLLQRQAAQESEQSSESPASDQVADILTEIRDILARIEATR